MTMSIGVFERQEDVLEAIRGLQQSGMQDKNIRVVVKDAESAPLIAANADVPIEDVQDIEGTGYRMDASTVPPIAGVAGGSASLSEGANIGTPGGVYIAAFGIDDEHRDRKKLLQEVGIPNGIAKQCEEKIDAGCYLLLAESGEDALARTVIREAGATEVWH